MMSISLTDRCSPQTTERLHRGHKERQKIALCSLCLLCVLWGFGGIPGWAQEQPPADVSILESRFSTMEPVVGEMFRYFLKFDVQEGTSVSPVEHFSENGLTIIETKRRDTQIFEGRLIHQYEYVLVAQEAGERQFIPVSIQYAGPLQNPVAAQPEPVQIAVTPVVDVQVVTNSPVMLNEPLELNLAITKRKPVTITAMPHTFEATIQVPPSTETNEQEAETPDQIPTPPPAPLRFELDQSQTIASQQTERGETIERYAYTLTSLPEQPGEYVLPEFIVTYRTETGEEKQVSISPTNIFVLNPNTGNLAVRTDYRFLILPAIISVVMVLSGLAVFLILRYRSSRRREKLSLIPPPLPEEVVRKELGEIQAMKLPVKGEFKQYYTLLSESIRKFLGAEFGFPVLERTTEEVVHDIQHHDVPDRVKERTGKFLYEADMVKFAKYIPLLEEADAAMEQALKIVDESVEYHRMSAVQPLKFRLDEPSHVPEASSKVDEPS